jgi:hypothetical protein
LLAVITASSDLRPSGYRAFGSPNSPELQQELQRIRYWRVTTICVLHIDSSQKDEMQLLVEPAAWNMGQIKDFEGLPNVYRITYC